MLLFSEKIHFKKHFKIAPSKNAFQNCYKLSIENKKSNSCGPKNARCVNYVKN